MTRLPGDTVLRIAGTIPAGSTPETLTAGIDDPPTAPPGALPPCSARSASA